MGTFGTGLFSNDGTLDLLDGLAGQPAEQRRSPGTDLLPGPGPFRLARVTARRGRTRQYVNCPSLAAASASQ
jgi:hypothetical protein